MTEEKSGTRVRIRARVMRGSYSNCTIQKKTAQFKIRINDKLSHECDRKTLKMNTKIC